MRLTDADRYALDHTRRYLRLALACLPETVRGVAHMGALLPSFIRSIDELIGTGGAEAPAAGPTGACDGGYHTGGCRCEPAEHAKAAGEPDEKVLAHVSGWPGDCGTVDAAEFGPADYHEREC